MICVARRVRLAVGDVLPDRRVEQLRVLQHEPDLPAQRPDREVPDVDAVDGDRAGVRVVEARDQADERGLAAAARPDQPDELTGLDDEGDVRSARDAPGRSRTSRRGIRRVPRRASSARACGARGSRSSASSTALIRSRPTAACAMFVLARARS